MLAESCSVRLDSQTDATKLIVFALSDFANARQKNHVTLFFCLKVSGKTMAATRNL